MKKISKEDVENYFKNKGVNLEELNKENKKLREILNKFDNRMQTAVERSRTFLISPKKKKVV